MTRNRRKIYFIHKQIQLKYAFLTISLLILYTLILLLAIFSPHALVIFSNLPLSEKSGAAEALLILHGNIWPGVGTIILLFGALSIFVTHKMAGPVFVFERMTRNIADGNLTVRARLRDGDDLHVLEENINRMADNFEAMLLCLDQEYGKLSSYIEELETELRTKNVSEEELVGLIERLGTDKNNIGKILDKYQYKDKTVTTN